MRLGAAIEGNLVEVLERQMEPVKRALKAGLKEGSADLKQQLRDQVTGSGMGQRLARSWRDDVYPKGAKTSFRAAAVVRSKAPKLVAAFDEGVTIRGKEGAWLAIPTEHAPKTGYGNKRITPENFPEHRYGKLRFIYRSGREGLLVVDGVRLTRSGRVGKQLKNQGRTKTGKTRKGVATIVMFVLVKQVRLPKKLNTVSAVARTRARLPRILLRHLDQIHAG